MENKTDKINAIGMMSGTSLDGVDIAAVDFWKEKTKWKFEIIAAETIPFSDKWKQKLKHSPTLPGFELSLLNNEFGQYLGKQAKQFIFKHNINTSLIASHGHTVFHQPEKGFTLQIGNGNEIAARTGITTISDFRSMDVALGGQGAPLVPVGDYFLFSDFDYCLNLGGFSNISFQKNDKRIAFDICPVNIILNYFAEKLGSSFDENGEMGRKGEVNTALLNKLNELPFYSQIPPKSLGREWLEKEFIPQIEKSAPFKKNHKKYSTLELQNILRTLYEHIAFQIGKIGETGKILITGGGAFNTFLLERIQANTRLEIVIPEKQLINFKEALIFAFLGVLRFRREINCFTSVTGAKKDSSVGIISF